MNMGAARCHVKRASQQGFADSGGQVAVSAGGRGFVDGLS